MPAGAALSALALAACFALPVPTADAQGQIRFGGTSSPPSMVEMPLYVALDRGFFKAEGVDVAISAFTGDPIAQRALIAGEVDVVNTNLSTTIAAVSNGAAVKAVASQVTKLTYLFIARKGIASVKDLAGKSIAVSAPGALSYHVP
ncbi:MAG: ABC transporter substrate-binding protein, partial [Alphaproteobacteria bacterium]|nr:ABC transporter substrate-binding protein [Alphaproteobacteria bacterium]